MNAFTELLQQEAEMKSRLQSIIADIQKDILNTPIPGVSKGPGCSMQVNFSTLFASPTKAMAAENFSAKTQAELVTNKLKRKAEEGPNAFLTAITQLCEDREVVIGANRHHLNETTVSILCKYKKQLNHEN